DAGGAGDLPQVVDGGGETALGKGGRAQVGHDAILPAERVIYRQAERPLKAAVGRADDLPGVVDVRGAGAAARRQFAKVRYHAVLPEQRAAVEVGGDLVRVVDRDGLGARAQPQRGHHAVLPEERHDRAVRGGGGADDVA